MRGGLGFRRAVAAVSRFFVFFLLVAFVISCCLMLFISVLQQTMGVLFTQEEITLAAKVTMLNTLLISLGLTVIDLVRRRFTVERPVRQITEAAERMIAGDFSQRIKPVNPLLADETFNRIIACVNQMAEELAGVETLRTDFIADVSHEMKTPLAVIQNYGTLLQAPGLPDAERIEYAWAMTEACRRLSDMMTNVLKLNRLENQQIYPHPERFDLGEQLCECLLQFENVWESRHMEIETALCEEVYVCADRELLYLVWNNLLSNAFKFTADGGRITLSLTADGGYATVRVRDTGCGMSAEVGAHIFEKFYQGDTSRATQGNGLGLSLVRRVVDIVQGDISVESTPGVGSEFTVRLRLAEREERV